MRGHSGFYFHRDKIITRFLGGWWIDGDLNIYKTISDAKNAIDKIHDGSNKKEPIIIGTAEWNDGIWTLKPKE